MEEPILIEGKRWWHSRPHFPVVLGKVYAENDGYDADPDDFTRINHTHDCPELVIVHGGTALHNFEGEDYPISAGDVFCILGNQMHYFHSMDHLQLINVMYDPDGLSLPLDFLRKVPGYNAMFVLEPNYRKQHLFSSRLTLSQSVLAHVVNLAESVYAELDSQHSGYEASCFAGLIRLILNLSRDYGQHNSKEAGDLLRIGNVLVALEEDPGKQWSLEDLAKIAHISPPSLIRAFKKATGLPPLEFLIQLRIRQSMELLAGTSMTITDIAFECGFNDSNYFARQFRRVNRMSATEYRERIKL